MSTSACRCGCARPIFPELLRGSRLGLGLLDMMERAEAEGIGQEWPMGRATEAAYLRGGLGIVAAELLGFASRECMAVFIGRLVGIRLAGGVVWP